ncbi:phosphatase PAP2 family protein [Streptomyces sp. NPDC054961]
MVLFSLQLPRGKKKGERVRVAISTSLNRALVVLASISVFGLVYALAVRTPQGQRWEGDVLHGAPDFGSPPGDAARDALGSFTMPFVLMCAALTLLALIWHGFAMAVRVSVVTGGSAVLSQILKHDVLPRPALDPYAQSLHNSLPSGHATLAMSLCAALVISVPERWRRWVAVPAVAWATSFGVLTVVAKWHRPSDVLAAHALVLTLTAAALLVPSSPRSQTSRPRVPFARTGSVLAAGVLFAVLVGAGAWRTGDPGMWREILSGAAGRYPVDGLAFVQALALTTGSGVLCGMAVVAVARSPRLTAVGAPGKYRAEAPSEYARLHPG